MSSRTRSPTHRALARRSARHRRRELTLDTVETDGPGNGRDVNFDPLVLPDGIEPSEDPMLSARSAAYAASYRLRTSETPSIPPEVQVDKVEEVAQ